MSATTVPATGLQLRTLVKKDGTLELSLTSVPTPEPKPEEVIVRMEASPINPSDQGLLFAGADMSAARASGTPQSPVVTATVPAAALKGLAGRFDQSLPAGNEGAGVVVKAGASPGAQALLGKTVAILGGSMYTQYRCIKAVQCLVLPPGTTSAEGASCFVNPLTALGMVETMRAEGHKALVFSQFTSFLAIVRTELDGAGIPYEYLDGRTRDRAARVERFQTDPDCLLFLVSLKAGGLGLNLTAAEYVFLLDPWWNPAVEAQAIDRTHRIGQTRPVFAYRLIARDTVEEKVLELQETKRALADSIISADESLIRTLTREDLELLLS